MPPLHASEVAAYAIVRELHRAGFEAYIVGGAVRDRLMARHPKDADVATSATPDEVQRLFPSTYAVGAAFGVIVVHHGDVDVEVATFRVERDYRDGRHPQEVSFATAAEDASRRDFTVNALFYDADAGEVVDHVGGLADLRQGIVRAIGDPRERFAEDHLRMLRAVRFTAAMGFALDAATAQAIRQMADRIETVSAERLFEELTRMLTGPRPHLAFKLLDEVGLLEHLLPEIAVMKGVEQPAKFHPEGDVFVHTLLLLELMVHPSPELAWACLLHDIGKPPTFTLRDDGREAFPCHAAIGADMAEAVLKRLRASRKFTQTVREMVAEHMTFANVQVMREAKLRRFMARPSFDLELELHRIDCSASNGMLGNYRFLLDRLHALANEPKLPPPLLTGHDVMQAGIPQGPAIGRLLEQLRDLQLSGELTTTEEAQAWLASFPRE